MSSTSQQPATSSGPSRLPRWATVLLTLLGVVMIAVLAVIGLFVWAFSGGWDGLRPAAERDDRQVVRERSKARGVLDETTQTTLRAVGPATEVARVRQDDCSEGQNNWKIHDGYTLRCELVDVVVLDVPDPSAQAAGTRLEPALEDAGWVAEPRGRSSTDPARPRLELDYTRGPQHADPTSTPRLALGAADGGGDPYPGYYSTSGSQTVSGDPDAVLAALKGFTGTRVVVRTSLRYFEDS